jgi:hypothetical protein
VCSQSAAHVLSILIGIRGPNLFLTVHIIYLSYYMYMYFRTHRNISQLSLIRLPLHVTFPIQPGAYFGLLGDFGLFGVVGVVGTCHSNKDKSPFSLA